MKLLQPRLAKHLGFTMIELLVVMAVLGVLAAAILPLAETLLTAQKERELRRALLEIRTALDEHKRVMDQKPPAATPGGSGYPRNLTVLVEGIVDPRPQSGAKTLYFLRRLPRDPFADPKLPAEQTWRLRSYASPPDRPAPGIDVYDVHSTSDAMALDGTAYARW
jgi:general secretion pathway protein G